MADMLSTGSGHSGGFYGGQPTTELIDPSYHPRRNSAHDTFTPQDRRSHPRQPSLSGAEHRSSSRSGPRKASSHGGRHRNSSQARGVAGRDQHAFGDDSDSDESSDEGQGFNVYNDFNNKGTKYSSNMGPVDQYRNDPFASSASAFGGSSKGVYAAAETTAEGAHAKEDMVMMPQLGQDWDMEEARKDKQWDGKLAQKRLGLRATRAEVGRGFSAWARGDKKLFGWLGWRQGVFLTFFLLAGLAVMLYFVVPRVPSLAYNHNKLLEGDDNSIVWNRTPANFTFNADLSLALDGRNSYVPAHATNIQVTVNDLGSTRDTVTVGSGSISSLTASTKTYTALTVPVVFKYSASNSSDPLWATWYAACGHEWGGNTSRPTLQLGIVVQFDIVGLIGRKGDSTQVNDVSCPVQLSATNA